MTSFLTEAPSHHWWVQIKTTIPLCQYYFGPFASFQEAEAHQSGFVEDLVCEHALEIVVSITYCQPEYLTLCDEEDLQGPSRRNSLNTSFPYERSTMLSHSSNKNCIPR